MPTSSNTRHIPKRPSCIFVLAHGMHCIYSIRLIQSIYLAHGSKIGAVVDGVCVPDVQLTLRFSPTVSLSVTRIELKTTVPGGVLSKTSVSYGTWGIINATRVRVLYTCWIGKWVYSLKNIQCTRQFKRAVQRETQTAYATHRLEWGMQWIDLSSPTGGTLTFWNSGALSFSSRTITLIGTSTKLSFSESPPDALTRSLIVTRNESVSFSWNKKQTT